MITCSDHVILNVRRDGSTWLFTRISTLPQGLQIKISLSLLLMIVAVSAITFAAMLRPSEMWLHAASGISYFTLSAAIVGVICLRGESRAFCIGLAVFAWLRFLAEFANLPFDREFDKRFLPPNGILYWMASEISDHNASQLAYLTACHLSTLITGIAGGVVGLTFTRLGRRKDIDGMADN